MAGATPAPATTLAAFEVPWTPPSLNKMLRSHWGKRRSLRKDCEAIALLTRATAPAADDRPRRLTLVRRSPRELDFDNLVGSYKPLVDAFVRAGLLTDDSPSSGNVVEYHQQKGPKATLVRLEVL